MTGLCPFIIATPFSFKLNCLHEKSVPEKRERISKNLVHSNCRTCKTVATHVGCTSNLLVLLLLTKTHFNKQNCGRFLICRVLVIQSLQIVFFVYIVASLDTSKYFEFKCYWKVLKSFYTNFSPAQTLLKWKTQSRSDFQQQMLLNCRRVTTFLQRIQTEMIILIES